MDTPLTLFADTSSWGALVGPGDIVPVPAGASPAEPQGVHRGWLVLGDAAPVLLRWPCRMAALHAALEGQRANALAERDHLVDSSLNRDPAAMRAALACPLRVVAWWLDRHSATDLGWSSAGPLWLRPDDAADPVLQALAVALADLVPGWVCPLGGPVSAVASHVVAEVLALESAGRSHGRCLSLMRPQVLAPYGLVGAALVWPGTAPAAPICVGEAP